MIETARATKALIKAYYAAEQKKSYFAGCSTGGRMANMEAFKFPNDFDGIISGAPALDYTGLVATFFAWLVQANTGPDGQDILPKSKVSMIRDKVIATCDAKDGQKDGLIDDPRKCDFRPSSLTCKSGDGPDCLTQAEAGVLEKWYAGARDGKGSQLYPGGLPLGSEAFWPLWLTGFEKGDGRLIPPLGDDFVRYMAFGDDPGETYGLAKFDFDEAPQRLVMMATFYNSTNPDLGKFKERDGKLIMYHGWADPIVTPQLTVDYYEAVEKKFGGREPTQQFLRLFRIPGFDHCGVQPGNGIDQTGFDPLTALENWAEKGRNARKPARNQARQGRQDRVDATALPLSADRQIQRKRRREFGRELRLRRELSDLHPKSGQRQRARFLQQQSQGISTGRRS